MSQRHKAEGMKDERSKTLQLMVNFISIEDKKNAF